MSKKVLGRGLSALIPEVVDDSKTADSNSIIEIKLDRIDPSPSQPRKDFDEEGLKELAVSIKETGIIQPIVVRRSGDRYEIIAGERRFRAAGLAGLETVRAIIGENLPPARRMEIALVENLQRTDLNPIEAAEGISELMMKGNLTQEQVAEKIGKERSTITNLLRLLNLPEEIQEDIRNGVISAGHGRTLAGIEDSRLQREFWKKIKDENWSVRKIEESLKKKNHRKRSKHIKKYDDTYSSIEDSLRDYLGTRVRIVRRGKKGHIEIEYYDDDQLSGILEKIGCKPGI
jgi:ParB family chromosome partitioning protein